MKEILCVKCNNSIEYKEKDYLYSCNYCNTSFTLNLEAGVKERFGDHYILPNKLDGERARELFFKFLVRNFHKSVIVNKEFFIKPFWVVSLAANTTWTGHSEKKQIAPGLKNSNESYYAGESGSFNGKYRWAILARDNIHEFWGMNKFHVPIEPINVDWNGFSFDHNLGSTEDQEKELYDMREFFNAKFGKGITLLSVQSSEADGITKVKEQITEYHRRVAKTKVSFLNDYSTEFEIAGYQLIHIPLWHVSYMYKPTGILKYFCKPEDKWALINGCTGAMIKFEHPIGKADKIYLNILVTSFFTLGFFILGLKISPLFYIISLFLALISVASAYRTYSLHSIDPDFILPSEEPKDTVKPPETISATG